MPELPDIVIYLESLRRHLSKSPLLGLEIRDPFILRTVDPKPESLTQKQILGFRRIGKRIVFEFEQNLFVVIHLMISGRLRWRKLGTKLPKRNGLVAFDFEHGRLFLTEAAKKRRARLHIVEGEENLAQHDPGGLEVLESSLEEFRERLTLRNHTLRRALTDPRLFSGIGNAYSDEILHHARLSPVRLTQKMSDDEIQVLYEAIRTTLNHWTDEFREEVGDGFPEKVTAFREGMAVHGKYQQPCPVCQKPVARIRYAENETNYCPTCQNDGRLLADRSLSKLLKKDWPRTADELELRLRGDST